MRIKPRLSDEEGNSWFLFFKSGQFTSKPVWLTSLDLYFR